MNAYQKDLSMRAMWIALAGALAVGIGCTPSQKQPEPPPPAPQIESFTVSPGQVNAGEKVKLEWATKNATRIELQQVGKGVISGAVDLSGSVEVTLDGDSLFVLTAKNARGVTESAAVAADVLQASDEVLFAASPQIVNAGDPVTLAWSASGARSVSLAVKDGAALDIGTQLQSGVVTVMPTANTTWVLTVDGQPYEGSVEVRPVVNAFALTPPAVNPGDTVTLSWKATGASKVTVTRVGDGVIGTETDAAKVTDGSLTWTVPSTIDPAAAITFGITAENASGSVTETTLATAYVAGAPRVRKVTVPSYGRAGSTFEVSFITSGADHVQVLQDGVVVNDLPTSGLLDTGTASLNTRSQDSVVEVRALSSRGGEDTSAPFTVGPVDVPTVSSFAASTSSISAGGDLVTLTWNVPSARHVRIVALNQFTVTEVTGAGAENGSIEAYPNKDTEYVLTADNGIGDTVTATTGTITVGAPAHLVFSPAAAPVGGNVQITGTSLASSGTMRALNFAVTNSPADAFVDIYGRGAELPFLLSDHTASRRITLTQPFETKMFGDSITASALTVSTDGWAAFADHPILGPAGGVPSSLPTTLYEPYAMIAYAHAMRIGPNSHVYWLDEGTGANRRIIIQWQGMEFYGANSKVVTVEVQIYPDHVVFAYPSIASIIGNSTSDKPLIGIINADESGALSPTADQLVNGIPTPGETLSFFGIVPPNYGFLFNGSPLEVEATVGNGVIHLSDAPQLIPAGQFSFSEVNNFPVAGHGEWFELVSNVNNPVDLNGWVIDFGGGSTHTISGPLVLPPHGRLLFGQDSDAAEASAGGPAIDYVYGSGFSMADGAGSVSISVAGKTYASLSWPQRSAGVAFQQGALSPGALYPSGTTLVPCSANQAYGASGQLGTPGVANSICTPAYAVSPGTPNSFISLASSPGSQVVAGMSGTGADNKVAQLTLTRPVPVFGLGYVQLTADANGWLSVTTPGSYPTNNTLPATGSPNGVFAPFWDDLIGNTNGATRWQQFDPDGTAATGDEYTVVAWEDYALKGITSSLNFEVVFLEGTGAIEFRYGTMTSSDVARGAGSSATTWIEDLTGTSAIPYNVNSASAPGITPNSTIHFTAQ